MEVAKYAPKTQTRTTVASGTYTTLSADDGNKVVLNGTASAIILDDASLSVNYRVTILNDTGGTVTLAYGGTDSGIQTLPATLAHGAYGYFEVEAANNWSFAIGTTVN